MNLVDTYWRDLALSNEAGVTAACSAVGAARYLLGPYCQISDAERLSYLRDVLAELNDALGLEGSIPTRNPPGKGGGPT